MWLLGINVGHNGSVALFNDKELVFYIEEDRLSRMKYDGNPYLGMEMAYKYTDHIDFLILCGTRNAFGKMPWTGEDPYTCYARKKQPYHKLETVKLADDHHLTHALTAFYNSGFEDAAALIIDGAGSGCRIEDNIIQQDTWEVESIWTLSYPATFKCHYKNYGANLVDSYNAEEDGIPIEISDGHGIVKSYEAVTQFLGFHAIEAGKTMGLAPYGKPNSDIRIHDGRFNNRSFIKPKFPSGNVLRTDLHPELLEIQNNVDWHHNENKISQYHKDLAYAVQKSSEERVCALIEKTIALTGKKKIVMAGGYGLNCVANYEFLKKFPDVEFYHEPVSHDGGNTMGVCQYIYRSISEDCDPEPLTSLYLGPSKSVDYDNDFDGFAVTDAGAQDVAKLLADGKIVCLYQGRSEGGPRALGNRSILFDPTVPNGKDIVNEVKRREWFRPFAGSCLEEKANEWFDLAGKSSSPFMMYAVDVLPSKRDTIPAITHVDGTCRVQTVNKNQNLHYYELISEFDRIKNVPILFNTSFNLAGDPLVETVDEALETLRRSDLDYLWLPEIGKLVTKSEFVER